MLRKLVKHEFKATRRIFLPLYLVGIILAVLERGMIALMNSSFLQSKMPVFLTSIFSIFATLLTIVFVVFLIGLLLLSVFYSVYRFYKNLMTDEGYLMFTLPVKPSQHTNAKLMTSMVWTLGSMLVVCLSIAILILSPTLYNEFLKPLFLEIPQIFDEIGSQLIFFIILVVASILVMIAYQILTFYFSVSLGQMMLPKHKIGGGIIAYFIVNTVTQILSLFTLPFILKPSMEMEAAAAITPASIIQYLNLILLVTLILNIIVAIGMYVGTNIILKKNLNLE